MSVKKWRSLEPARRDDGDDLELMFAEDANARLRLPDEELFGLIGSGQFIRVPSSDGRIRVTAASVDAVEAQLEQMARDLARSSHARFMADTVRRARKARAAGNEAEAEMWEGFADCEPPISSASDLRSSARESGTSTEIV